MKIKIIDQIEKIKYEDWKNHYIKYLIFNKNKIAEKNLKKLWEWLNDHSHPQKVIFALVDKNIAGHAHYRGSPNAVRGKDVGFLDDIFVNPEYRKLGVASTLMKKLRMEGKNNNWELIRWNCNFDNLIANNLYLKTAKKLDWNTFEMKI